MVKLRIGILFVLNFWFISAIAQDPMISFKHLSLREGLSQSPIFSIMQDRQGFIWIGSRNGLTRYDGYDFKLYSNPHLDKIAGQQDINSIYEDADSNLWLATSVGLYQFIRGTETFIKIPIKDVKFTSVIYPAGNGNVWVATDRGIKILNCKKRQVKDFISHQISGLFVHALCKDKSGRLWSGSAAGLRCYSASTGKLLPLEATVNAQLNTPVKRIVAIKEDNEGDMWFGTEDAGLFWHQNSTKNCTNFSYHHGDSNTILSDFVRDVYVNKTDELWIGTRDGLSIFNKQTRRFSNYEHNSEIKGSLSYNTIWKIMKDKVGSIWLTTYAGGLNIYNPINANFKTIGERVGREIGLNKPVVNALLGDGDGGIWAGTDGGGLNYINTNKNSVRYFSVQELSKNKSSNIVKGLAKDLHGNLWVATLDGLARFDPKQGKVHYVDLEGKNSYSLFRTNGIIATASGIWVAGDVDGLKFLGFDGKVKAYRHASQGNSILSNHINALLEAENKKGIWIASNEGLSYLDVQTEKFINYRTVQGGGNFRADVIVCLFPDRQGRLWLGTQSGLRLFNENRGNTFQISKDNGLADNAVQAITEDLRGNLWVSTRNGISQIKFNGNTKEMADRPYKVISYTSVNGLASNLWMPNSVYRSPAGEIFFGGVNGINAFDPNRIIKNNFMPTVVVTEFLVKNEPVTIKTEASPLTEPIESTRSIRLKYDQNSISFRFSAMNFVNTQKNSYAYKMEGLSYNQDWNYSSGQRSAVYTGLEPGKYLFKVKAANNDGLWSSSPHTISIVILPPFWASWWAYIFYALLGLSIFYFIVRFFRRQAKLERDLFYEQLQYERQQELHQTKLNFFTNISHELRTPLTLIAAPIEKLVKETAENPYLSKQLGTIQSNTNRLLKLINELMDFRKTETGNMQLKLQKIDVNAFAEMAYAFFSEVALANNITYTFNGFEKPVAVYIDVDQLEKVLLNLLSNSFKFTAPGGKIEVKLIETKELVQLSIIDNGIGIPFEDQKGIFTDFFQGGKDNPKHIGTGIGLAFSKSIVDLHHGSLDFKSNPTGADEERKTIFTVSLPKGALNFNAATISTARDQDMIAAPVVDSTLFHYDVPEPAKTSERKNSILVIEDNEEVREFIIESLNLHYIMYGSRNGLEGYEFAITEIPDLIITDVMMPEMDGMELCRKLKSDQRTNHIPVIMLTARAAPIHHISGLEQGADVYIAKPFSLDILQLNIRNLLMLRRRMQEKFSEQVVLQPKDVVITTSDGKYLHKLLEIIERRMDDSEFGVAELAADIGMSQPVLYRKVKALTDLSVADFIKSIRLKRAASLLVQNKMSIADVAFSVGFNDRKHFSKEFRKQFDESPTTFSAKSGLQANEG